MKILLLTSLLILIFVGCSREKNPISTDFDVPDITWKSMNLKLSRSSYYVHKIDINSKNDIFIGTNEPSVYRLLHNDTSWTLVHFLGHNIWCNVIYVDQKGEIFVGYRGGIPVIGGCVDQSKDNGDSWTKLFFSDQGVNCFSINNQGNYFIGSYSFFRSADNGQSWDELTYGLSKDAIISITYDNVHGILFIGTENEGIYRSFSNGDDWEYVGLKGNRVFALSFNKVTKSTFAGTGMGIFRTRDNGKSWANINVDISDAWIMCVSITDEGFILMGTEKDGAFLSTNDGRVWHNIGFANQRVYGIAVNNNKYIYAVTDSSGVVRSEQQLIY